MNTRKIDIEHLIRHNIVRINGIRKKRNLLKIKLEVKSILQDYISILDYIAMDINEAGPNKNPRQIFFPLYDNEENFKKSAQGSWVGPMEILNIDLYNLILSIQPFVTGNPMLTELIKFNNLLKHRQLIEIDRRTTKWGVVTTKGIVAGGYNGKVTGNIVDGKKVPDIEIKEGRVHKISPGDPEIGVRIEIVDKETVSFDGHSRDLFQFLFFINEVVEDFSRKIYELLEAWNVSKS
ncbi:hypothetical protein [Lunatibacter salilacus]|uniref:hypothetical protein n=1 Tax=Lunatibacter salilacus TaxID=2483804 RepID=UPI00131B4E8E|nr:hypothetical protein [Lunatibacter salilacus]